MTAAVLSADTLNQRVLTIEALEREAFRIHAGSGLGSAYVLGALSALVTDDVWAAAVTQAQIALGADQKRKAASQ